MRKVGITLLLIFCSLTPEIIMAVPAQTSRKTPPAYYEDYGACPFECCTYRRWTVNADTVIYKDRSAGARSVFRVRKGEHVVGLTGVVITLKPGRAVVKKATTLDLNGRKLRVRAGDMLYLLHYQGEGFYKFWFGGRIYEAEMPFAPDQVYPSANERPSSIEQLSEPQTVWWVKVRNKRGQTGWSRQDDHFGDMDSCA